MSITKEYAGGRYGLAFLLTDSRLSDEEKDYLFGSAIKLYLTDKKNTKIKTDTLEGRVHRSKLFTMLGNFSGPQYEAEVDSKDVGTVKLSFIVSELTPGRNSQN